MAGGKLSQKQEMFCVKYAKHGNATRAYKEAYNAQNMKPATIYVKACELLKNGKIEVRLKELNQMAVSDAVMTKQEALQLLSVKARIRITDVCDFRQEQVGNDEEGNPVDDGKGGYLVIKKPWPGMLRGIWGDMERYVETYWAKFPGMYFPGDGAVRDEDGCFWILGRVDDEAREILGLKGGDLFFKLAHLGGFRATQPDAARQGIAHGAHKAQVRWRALNRKACACRAKGGGLL